VKNACEICPSEQCCTASIKAAKMLSPFSAAAWSRSSAASASSRWRAWKSARRSSWLCFGFGGPAQFDGSGRGLVALRVEEGVDPDDGQRPVVLAVLVGHRLVLDAATLVPGLHGAEHSAVTSNVQRSDRRWRSSMSLKTIHYRYK